MSEQEWNFPECPEGQSWLVNKALISSNGTALDLICIVERMDLTKGRKLDIEFISIQINSEDLKNLCLKKGIRIHINHLIDGYTNFNFEASEIERLNNEIESLKKQLAEAQGVCPELTDELPEWRDC